MAPCCVLVAQGSDGAAHPSHAAASGTGGLASAVDAAAEVPLEEYGGGRIVDITHAYRPDLPAPGRDGLGPVTQLTESMANGSINNVSELRMVVHAGTHVDAPGHMVQEHFEAGPDVDKLDLDVLNGLALLVDVPRDTNITGGGHFLSNMWARRVTFPTPSDASELDSIRSQLAPPQRRSLPPRAASPLSPPASPHHRPPSGPQLLSVVSRTCSGADPPDSIGAWLPRQTRRPLLWRWRLCRGAAGLTSLPPSVSRPCHRRSHVPAAAASPPPRYRHPSASNTMSQSRMSRGSNSACTGRVRAQDLPLIPCVYCGIPVVYLESKQTGTLGQIFFKCPNNYKDDSRSCPFFKSEAEYRAILARRMGNEHVPEKLNRSFELQWLQEENELKQIVVANNQEIRQLGRRLTELNHVVVAMNQEISQLGKRLIVVDKTYVVVAFVACMVGVILGMVCNGK